MLLVEGTTTRDALQWALDVAVRPQDHLHVLTVGRPTAKLVGCAKSGWKGEFLAWQVHLLLQCHLGLPEVISG